MFVIAIEVALTIFKTALLYKAYPASGLAFALQQLATLVVDGFTLALAQLMNILQVKILCVCVEWFCHVSVFGYQGECKRVARY